MRGVGGSPSPGMGSAGLERAPWKRRELRRPLGCRWREQWPSLRKDARVHPRTSMGVCIPRERGKGYQLPFKQQKNPTDKESQTRSGAPSALPLSPVETAASQSQSLMTARGFLSPQHAGLVAITQKKSAKTCAPPCSPSPARSQ